MSDCSICETEGYEPPDFEFPEPCNPEAVLALDAYSDKQALLAAAVVAALDYGGRMYDADGKPTLAGPFQDIGRPVFGKSSECADRVNVTFLDEIELNAEGTCYTEKRCRFQIFVGRTVPVAPNDDSCEPSAANAAMLSTKRDLAALSAFLEQMWNSGSSTACVGAFDKIGTKTYWHAAKGGCGVTRLRILVDVA